MNTPANQDDELRCAEYALGVLSAAERRELEQAADANPLIQATLHQWQSRIARLAEDVEPIAPPPRVWQRIQRDLGAVPDAPRTAHPRPATWWDNLRLWRWVGLGASLAALALLAVNVVTLMPSRSPPAVTANAYMVSTIARQDGVAHWTATVDRRRSSMVVVPVVKPVIAAGRATELWLIPRNAKPIPLGVFASDQPASMTLSPQILAQMDSNAVLAVSVEPPGGSPTGQPTGPVVATGAIRPA
ncbi:anti-sigma-K factor RskA [Pandoraea cepalis]|uniref:Anti-sigma-K factor RskA n=1 Tax=Pandoraea cepalis TaxID=2508294 RepID=A0A5E4W866_9BURK|nr:MULTISPECIES: anti-sigma factor [Pandoraea]BDD94334.1 anti-sigma K factor RskA [Pandoraea sp. NE5]VVE20912.1 anti-sigma-K factor RskA [Pandoraea cepalis]